MLVLLLMLLFTPLAAVESVDLLPVMHKGRIRPFSAVSSLWMEETLGHQETPTNYINPSILLIDLHFFGPEKLHHVPLLLPPRIKLRKELGLSHKNLYTYDEIDSRFEKSDELLKEVIAYEFANAGRELRKNGQLGKKELAELSSGLIVGMQGDNIVIKRSGTTGPLKRLKEDTIVLAEAKDQLEGLISDQKEKADEIIQLIKRMALFDLFGGSQGIQEEYQKLAERLIQKETENKKIASRLEKEFPLKLRLHTFVDPLKMLPSKYDPSDWISLKALGLKVYDEKSNSLVPIPNFTLFLDEDFNRIQKGYHELIAVLEKEHRTTPFDPLKGYSSNIKHEINRFANRLHEAYAPLSGQDLNTPHQTTVRFPTASQLRAEHFYLALPSIRALIALYGLALFALVIDLLVRSNAFQSLGTYLTFFAFLFHTALLALRIYILGRPPVATMFETLLYTPWVSTLLALILNMRHKTALILAASNAIAIVLLTLSFFADTTASLETIQPVLRSHFWLMVHVLLVVGSYGVFIFAGLLGHIRLIGWFFHQEHAEWMRHTFKPLIASLYTGVILLILGTILGGIWANMSWGRFWDWDPKESWALISALTYLCIIHLYRIKAIGPFGISLGACIGLLAITFTWYGVNYLLGSGLHSYGFSSGGAPYYLLYIALETAFISICLIRFLTTKRKWEITPPVKRDKKL